MIQVDNLPYLCDFYVKKPSILNTYYLLGGDAKTFARVIKTTRYELLVPVSSNR